MEGSQRKRVLVAEDDPILLELLAHLLQRNGLNVDVAGNGRDAAALIQQGGYDALVIDLELCCGGGQPLAEVIAARELSLLERTVGVTALETPGPANATPKTTIRRPFELIGFADMVTKIANE